MPVKDIFRDMQPVQLYVLLTLTVLFFSVELSVSYLTHSLTLLMDSYHMLCNIIALTGCIITIKYGGTVQAPEIQAADVSTENFDEITLKTECQDKKGKKLSRTRTKQERKLRNTFGWTRIDVITMLICCVFVASFCFSVYVEALQTLGHIDHQDAIHQPVAVLFIGTAGLMLNGLCYLLIGGYTFHQGSFLYVTESGDVVLNNVVVNDSVQKGARRLSRTRQIFSSPPKKRQGLWEMSRDVVGCTLVIICSISVIFTEPEVAKFMDPILALVSCTLMIILSYPYMKESCMILLQTMPDTIDIEIMKKELVNHFPHVVNVHDFHIWQLTASKVISTVHIIFENPAVYRSIMKDITDFFLENGVTQVTIQPEFFRQSTSFDTVTSTKFNPICLVACQEDLCKINHCCQSYEEISIYKGTSKEVLPTPERTSPVLTAVRMIGDETRSIRSTASTYSINSDGDEVITYHEESTVIENQRGISESEAEVTEKKNSSIVETINDNVRQDVETKVKQESL